MKNLDVNNLSSMGGFINKKIKPLKDEISIIKTELKNINEQLNLSGVSQCNELSKPKVSSKTILLINRKDGLTDLYTDDGCLGVGLNNEEVKKITGVSYCG